MSQIKGKDTGLERIVRSALHRKGLRFRKHMEKLPGRPDAVFPKSKVALFVDGDFWHGYRYPNWKGTMSAFWQAKIELNRRRDQKNLRRLRRAGWRVIRVWQHEIERDLPACIRKIVDAIHGPSGTRR